MNRFEKKNVVIVCATVVSIALITSMTVLAMNGMWPFAIGVMFLTTFNQFLAYAYY